MIWVLSFFVSDATFETVLTGLIGGVLTLFGKWITEKYRKDRNKEESLKSILEANKAYREELRLDLINAKKEIKECHALIEKFKEEIIRLKERIESCHSSNRNSREVDD